MVMEGKQWVLLGGRIENSNQEVLPTRVPESGFEQFIKN